ncbi:Sperm-associated antigen 8 [Boothiomyces sp. JEL0866]|nr:Sperm-associated antigen 8 [Boothiomyces sp. JEL0866]
MPKFYEQINQMRHQSEHSSAWNRHNGVGATLLENWVEERAVGDKIIKERSNIVALSKQGHDDILKNNSKDKPSYRTTHADTYATSQRALQNSLGKRRQYLEAELLKRAMHEEQVAAVDEKEHWKTTTAEDFAHTDLFPPTRKLGAELPNQELRKKYEKPITFWTDYAVKGSGTAICSSDAKLLHDSIHKDTPNVYGHRAGQAHQHEASTRNIMFGRKAAFSTPIQEYQKGECKE